MSGIYRPHSDSIENFTISLDITLNSNTFRNNSSVLLGDFNLNLFSNSNDTKSFIEMMRSHHFLQTITDATHPGIIGHSSASLIDHIWINTLNSYNSCIIKAGITDHHSTYIQLPFLSNKTLSKRIKIYFRDCSEDNQINFRNKLQTVNWSSLSSNDVNHCMQNFIETLYHIYCESFPLKSKHVTEKYFLNPWYTPEIRKLTEARSNYNLLFNENLVSHNEYALFRNRVTLLIRNSKQQYFRQCFERNMSNIKATWKLIKKN